MDEINENMKDKRYNMGEQRMIRFNVSPYVGKEKEYVCDAIEEERYAETESTQKCAAKSWKSIRGVSVFY